MDLIANRYRVVRPLGEGGMGQVYLVADETLGREVALKALRKDAPEGAALQFKQEFFAMAQIRHPNLVQAFDYGTDPAVGPYFTMEAVPGESLDTVGRKAPGEVRALLPQLLDALAAIHARGLVHGDVKPENLRLTPEGRIVLMDLGLITQAGRSGEAAFGTLEYMAPEVLRKGRVDHRADLYSVGVVLFRLLCGRLPFEGASTTAFVRASLSERPQAPSKLDPEISAEWDAAILRLLAKEPADRFATAAEVAESLGLVLESAGETPLLAPRFVGREREMEVLTDRLGHLLSNAGGNHVILVGEPGIGKSRLVDEFRTRVQLSEAMLLACRCRPGSYPYQPFADLLRQALPQIRALAPQVAERTLPHLARILPDLGIQAAPALDPDQEKIRLQTAFSELLRALSQIRASVFVLEDWQHADSASAELLRTLGRTGVEAPWMWVLSADRPDIAPPGFREVPLDPLTEDELADMVGSKLGMTDSPRALAARLLALTSGIPALVEEVMTHWVKTGAIVREGHKWSLSGAIKGEDMPTGLLDLMESRAAALAPATLAVGRVAAAIGLEFELAVLAEASGLEAEALFPSLLDLVGRGILEATGTTRYRFMHPPMEAALYRMLPQTERPALHTAIARALEAQTSRSLEAICDIARHHLEGLDQAAAVRWALEAGRSALELFAIGDAERLLGAGFARAAGGAERGTEVELEYRVLLGDLSRLASRLDPAHEHYAAGIALARTLGDIKGVARCALGLARVHQMRNEHHEATRWLSEALPAAKAAGDARAQARCLLSLSRISHFDGRSAEGVDYARQALGFSREHGLLPQQANAECWLGFLLTNVEPRQEVEGLQLLQASVELARSLGDRYQMNESTLNLGNVQLTLGDYPGARDSFEACLAYCQQMGAASEEVFALLSLSEVLVAMGRAADALAYAETAASQARAQNRKFPLAFSLAVQAVCKVQMGEIVAGKALIAEGLKLAREINNRYVEVLILVYDAEIRTYLGEWEQALQAIAAARELMAATGNTESEVRVDILAGFVNAMLYGGDQALKDALAVAQRQRSQGQAARAIAYQAQVARRDERLQEAQHYAFDAGALATEVQALHLSGEMALLLGDLAKADDRAEAFDYYFTAHDAAGLLKAPLLKALALHGMAETADSSTMAINYWEQAVAEFRKLVAPLDQAARESFLRYPERRAVLADRPLAQAGEQPVDLRHVQRLVRFAAALSRQEKQDSLLQLALEEILDLANAERGFLLLYDGLELQSRVIAARGEEAVDMEMFSSSVAKQVLWTGEPVYLVDALSDERFRTARSVMALDLKTVLCLPLVHMGDSLGVIYVDSQSVQVPLSNADLEVALALAQLAASAIAGTRRSERAEARTRAFEAVSRLARPAATGDAGAFYKAAIQAALDLAGGDRGFVFRGTAPECLAAYDRNGRPIPVGDRTVSESICTWTLATGEPVSVLDAQQDVRWQQQRSVAMLDLRTVHCVPIVGDDGPVGLLYLDSQDVAKADTEGLAALAEVLGAFMDRAG